MGDVQAQLYLRGTTSGVGIRYYVYKCADSTCSTSTEVVPTTTVKSATLGEIHSLGIGWNGAVFTFTVDGVDTVVNPADCGAYPACQSVVNASPNSSLRALVSQVQIAGAGGEGSVAGDFDNVYVNETLYDDFDGAPFSGPRLDPAKWATLEFVREIQNGKFVSKLAAGSSTLNATQYANSYLVTAARANVTVTAYESTGAFVQAAALSGIFYNDGESATERDYTGDVGALLRVSSSDGGPLTVRFLVDRCGDVRCTIEPAFFIDDLGTVNVGETHTLFLKWDGAVFTYGVENWGLTRTFDPRSYYPPVKPPRMHSKHMRTRVWPNIANAYGYVAATIDHLYVNDTAAILPKLDTTLTQTVNGGVTSAGVGLRDTGTGTITLAGLPLGAVVQKAFLYWATWGSAGTFTSPTLNGVAVSGNPIGQSEGFWGASQAFAYRADVTGMVTG